MIRVFPVRYTSMHDLLLAKEIIEALQKIASDKKIIKAKSVNIEIGRIAHIDHVEDINAENLKFGLENMAKNTAFENADFKIKKTGGSSWKIVNIEV